MGIIWIILSYILGSIPFGYLISRLSGKNVLKIGWRKNSGSNVFKNVGKWQGVLTGLLDIAKGYLAVFGAQIVGLPIEFQVFSGVAAVIGHNWSLFLCFAGGRGIGTFVGAFLAISPQILLLSVIPLIVLGLVWTASIGTLLFLIAAVFFSFYFDQVETAGLFTFLCLIPILIKRLSPFEEIKKTEKKGSLIINRLLFDDDVAHLHLRIKRIFQKEKNKQTKIAKLTKSLFFPVLFPSKLGWKAAKYGARIAKNPIKFIFKDSEKVVTEINTDDFKKMMIAASKKIVLHQEEINRINVFPVADKDTGYNLAATLLGVEGVISQKNYSTFRELTHDIKEAAMINARGNAGMIYTGYIIEVLDRIKHLKTIDAFHFALAMKRGIKAARSSVLEPVEGTILDVIKVAGNKTFELVKSKKEKNIIKILKEADKISQISLKETKEKLQVLKDNNVVDAGALGFVKILESWTESLKGVPITGKPETGFPVTQSESIKELKYSHEVVFSFRKLSELDFESLKKELSLLGGSLEILELEGKVKIHIHTNDPEAVRNRFKNMPEFKARIEDLRQQVKKVEKKPLGLVVDEVADLPWNILEKYDIMQVPFISKFPNGEIVSSKEEIYQKMKEALKNGKPLPTTSAPSFKEFVSVFEKAFKKFEKILVITVSSKLSGTYSSARIARSTYKKPKKLNIYVFDCNTAEVAEGLTVVKAAELIQQGKNMEEVVDFLKDFCPRITLIACINDFRYVVRGGRLKMSKLFIKPVSFIQKMGIRFLVGLKNGRVNFFGATLGKDIARILAEEVKKEKKGRKIRLAIAHADRQKEAEKLKSILEKESDIEILFVSSVSSVVATHTGPGVLIVAFHPIDT